MILGLLICCGVVSAWLGCALIVGVAVGLAWLSERGEEW